MKKTLTILAIFMTFFIFYFLQVNFFNWFTIAGIMPNLFVILILFVGLFAGRTVGISVGVVCGLLLDLFIGRNIGTTGVMLALIGFLGGYFDKNFSKDSKITIILMVIGVTIIYEVGKYIMNVLILHYNHRLWFYSHLPSLPPQK